MQLRQNAQIPTYFCECERLSKRWANNNERPHV
jgi:hypothetical protein